MLDTYAEYDETGRTTEDGQLRRDAKLLTHLARIHHLDWSTIALDVAPELVSSDHPTMELALPAPSEHVSDADTRPPTGPGSPTLALPREKGIITPAPNVVALSAPRRHPSRRKVARNRAPRTSAESKVRAVYKPGMSASELSRVAGIGISAASKWKKVIDVEQSGQAAQ